jgi:transcription initiation factor TFIIIB Brf1 subunit/transcription initiation factor TFIIB
VPLVDPMKCIVKIANKAELSEKTTRLAMNMMTEIIESKISAGKNPMSFAATVLYISSVKAGEKLTQLDIANAAGVTEVTIRNRVKELNNTFHRTRLDMEVKKKELTDTLTLQNAQLVDLGQTIAHHQNTIDSKKEQLLKWTNS